MTKRILIVDDGFEDIEEMKQVLDKAGYKVSTATNGAQVIDMIDELDYDLFLVDIRMPTLTGYDLLRLLRDRLDGKAKMVYVSIVPKDKANLTDVDGFVQKPFADGTLLNEVKRVLG
jgi:two-component system, OmpR family, response regulator SaeR